MLEFFEGFKGEKSRLPIAPLLIEIHLPVTIAPFGNFVDGLDALDNPPKRARMAKMRRSIASRMLSVYGQSGKSRGKKKLDHGSKK